MSNNDVDQSADDKKDTWDDSWSEMSKSRSGGVFRLPPEDKPPPLDVVDGRIDWLTSVWSSENGFLLAIAVIVLIGCFYVYVFVSGGIPH